jgi:ABC-type lipopolysaccharide export system ATPase subunit
LGGLSLAAVNGLANKISGLDRWRDPDLQKSRYLYPGQKRCKRTVSHAKWHEVIYNGLSDGIVLVNDAIRIIRSGKKKKDDDDNDDPTKDLMEEFQLEALSDLSGRSNLLDCYQEHDCFSGFQ